MSSSDSFRQQYLGEWPVLPERSIPDDAKKPWMICGSGAHVLMREKYGASRQSANGTFELPNGSMRRVYGSDGIRGVGPGTLFVVGLPTSTTDKIISVAATCGWRIVALE